MKFSSKLDIIITAILEDKLPNGLGDDIKDSKFSKAALKQGTKVEKEHTKNSKIAKEIAKDHLTEFPGDKNRKDDDDPDYYEALDAMEKMLGGD